MSNKLINPSLHQSHAIATSILSSSLNGTSQFISPPLPGVITDDHIRDRSNDHDLKRDINVNSLILNSNSIFETFSSESSNNILNNKENYQQEEEEALTEKQKKFSNLSKTKNGVQMMMVSNAVKYEPMKLLKVNAGQINQNMTNESITNNNTIFLKQNNKNLKFDFITTSDVLKAAEGDIIFGNHNQQNHQNLAVNNQPSYSEYINRYSDKGLVNNELCFSDFLSKKKLSLSADSLPNTLNKDTIQNISQLSQIQTITKASELTIKKDTSLNDDMDDNREIGFKSRENVSNFRNDFVQSLGLKSLNADQTLENNIKINETIKERLAAEKTVGLQKIKSKLFITNSFLSFV